MIGKIHHHLVLHVHEDGQSHRAHALSIGALFAYLQLFLVLIVGVSFIRLQIPTILGTATFGADQIIELTNKKRAENGLPNLVYNQELSQAALAKAQDMFANDYWAHYGPQGRTPWSFINASGYKYIFAGENLARDFDDPASVVNAWMNSPSHRSNLLDKNFREIGVAVSYGKLSGKEGTLVVQMFGTSPNSGIAENVSPPTVTIAPPGPELAQSQVLSSRKFALARGASLVIVGFIFALFSLEVVISLKRSGVRVTSGVVAHMAILAFVLLAVWYSTAGTII